MRTVWLMLGPLLVELAAEFQTSVAVTGQLAAAIGLSWGIFEPVTWTLTAEFAGESRATANGLLATSNQLGALGGASVGGLVLALGGFVLVGVFCLAAAMAAAAVVLGLKVWSAQEFRLRLEGP